MGEQNFSWKVVAAARCCSVHFDKETNIQLLQPRGMDAHKDSLSITANPGLAVSSSIFPVGVLMSLLRFYPASSREVKSPPFLCSQNHQHRLHRFTSHQSVTDEWGKKSKHIHPWASEKCDAGDKGNKYCDPPEPFKLSFEAKPESLHSDSSRRRV